MLATGVPLVIFRNVLPGLIPLMVTAMKLVVTVLEEDFAITLREPAPAFLDSLVLAVNIKQLCFSVF